MNLRCHIAPGSRLDAVCFACGHPVSSHLQPTGLCIDCTELALARLDMTEELHIRVDRLAYAVQVLTERLNDAHLDRLDVIASAWPKRERTPQHDH